MRWCCSGVDRPGQPRAGAGALPAGAGQALRPAGPPDHPGHQRGIRQAPGAGRGLPPVAAGGPGRCGGSPAGGTGGLPGHGRVPAAGLRRRRCGRLGGLRVRCTSGCWKTTTGTANCCRCWSCSMTTTVRSRTWPPSCTCTGAASTTGWAGSGRLLGVDPLKGMARLELHAALKTRRWAGRPRI